MKNQFRIINDKNTVSQDVKEIIYDSYYSSKYKTIESYFISEKINYSKTELTHLRKIIQKNIISQIEYICYVIYHMMNLSNNWPPAGEQQALNSFCRIVLGIGPGKDLTTDNTKLFFEKINSKIQELNINIMDQRTAKETIIGYKINLCGFSVNAIDTIEINRILQFTGIKYRVYCGKQNNTREYILFEARHKQISGYDIFFIEKEKMRSPSLIMNLAALITPENIFIRKEALITIIKQKWAAVFIYNDHEDDIYVKISETIKRRCLTLFKIDSAEYLLKHKKTFIKDMEENIFYHEIGHGSIHNYALDMVASSIADGTDCYTDSVLPAIAETLADIAPDKNKLKGTITNIIDISKKDRVRAERMFYMYLSDVWFFDTEDTYMYLYSELILLILLPYIKPDKTIDFKLMEEKISFNSKNTSKQLIDIVKESTDYIQNIIVNATYYFPGAENDYFYLKKLTLLNLKKKDITPDESSYNYHSIYWSTVLTYSKVISNKNKEIQRYLDEKKQEVRLLMLKANCGEEKAQKYLADPKIYIAEKMKELNFID
ncbi:MAG: hypothetical protein GY730_06100 [bacterium]|nr:hypothetical protein [bacterium]